MSLFTAKGQAAKESASKKNVDLKKAYIRLKENESVRVRLLGVTDYVEYMAHGEFNLGIYTQPCIHPLGKECPLCIASKSGIEGFDKLYAKKRYLFAFADLDTGELRVWDATKSQGLAMMDLIEEYAEVVDEVAFTLKRTGTKTDTNYNLLPIMKLSAEDKEKFAKFEGQTVPEDFFETVLIPRTEEQMIEGLKAAGFPVDDFFGVAEEEAPGETKEGQPIEISDDDLPF